MAPEAILTLLVPLITALGSAAIAYFLMNARMTMAIAREREMRAQERAEFQAERNAIENHIRAAELNVKRTALETVLRLQHTRAVPEVITAVPMQALPPLSIFQSLANGQSLPNCQPTSDFQPLSNFQARVQQETKPEVRIAVTKLLPPPALAMKAAA